MEKMELWEKIRYTREYRGKSRKELGDYLGLSDKTIGGMEIGTKEIKPVVLKAISRFLDIPLDFYLDEEVRTLEELLAKRNVKAIAENIEKYGGYFKMVDIAKDEGITPEDFKAFLEFRRKLKRQD